MVPIADIAVEPDPTLSRVDAEPSSHEQPAVEPDKPAAEDNPPQKVIPPGYEECHGRLVRRRRDSSRPPDISPEFWKTMAYNKRRDAAAEWRRKLQEGSAPPPPGGSNPPGSKSSSSGSSESKGPGPPPCPWSPSDSSLIAKR